MRLLFLGDVMGRSGRRAVSTRLPGLIAALQADFVVVNGENAAGGTGITESIHNELIAAGADAVTTGNHVWGQREALVFIERAPTLLRPANYPAGTPGRGAGLFTARNTGARVLVINVMGQVFMPILDDPFATLEREIAACGGLGAGADAIIVDVHAEATSEKQAVGHFLDGRASLVVGTHTHVPTADHRIQPEGTAYISDVGMCGDFDSIIGVDKDEPMRRFLTKIGAGRFEPATGEATICGVVVDTDDRTGLATAIAPLRLGGALDEAWPDFAAPPPDRYGQPQRGGL